MKEYVTSFTILPQFVLAGTEEATEELRKFDVSDEIPMTHLYNPSQKKLLFMFFFLSCSSLYTYKATWRIFLA